MNKLNKDSKIILNNGLEMPVIGLGVYKAPEGEEVYNAVKWALEAGYRMIDTAMIYKNEEGVGRAIKDSGIPREEIFLTTKLHYLDQGYESALQAIDVSLSKLGTSYVDLYLVHWPSADKEKEVNKRAETWQAMEEIYASGKAKAIGVSNYTVTHLEEMKTYMKIPPTVNQVEFHPFLFQKELLIYCRENKIILEAYRSLANGQKMDNQVISNLANKYNKSGAQILIRWCLQHGCISIPKSVHKERIEENINVFDFEITSEDMESMDKLNENMHLSWNPYNLQ